MSANLALAVEPDSPSDPLTSGPREVQPSTGERVLLLEDDPTFKEIIRDYLTESGYTVVTVQNGVEGVHEVIASDFAVVLCDMLMPKMPGDMFYRAVERTRPKLCDRFVFMTGHRGNDKTNDFIQSVNGKVLTKPFPMDDLLDTVALIHIRTELINHAPEPEPEPATTLVDDQRPAGDSPPWKGPMLRVFEAPVERSRVAEPAVAPSRPPVAPVELPKPTPVAPAPAARPTIGGRTIVQPGPLIEEESRIGTYAAWLFVFLLVAGLGAGFMVARNRATEAAAELQAVEADWKSVLAQQEESERTRPDTEVLLGLPARIVADRETPRWAPALRILATYVVPEITLREIRASRKPNEPGACELRITGVATGNSPLAIAEKFRAALQSAFEREFRGMATVNFEKVGNERDQRLTVTEEKTTQFVIKATVGSTVPAGQPEVTRK